MLSNPELRYPYFRASQTDRIDRKNKDVSENYGPLVDLDHRSRYVIRFRLYLMVYTIYPSLANNEKDTGLAAERPNRVPSSATENVDGERQERNA